MEKEEIGKIIEAMLISTEEPISVEQMQQALSEVKPLLIKEAIEDLKRHYMETDRSFEINEVAGGYQIGTKAEYARYLRKLYKTKHVERLSKPALETLAIIAYKQPATKLDIESIRGVNVDGVIRSLLDKGLIRIKGRKEVIGRPFIYGTSSLFLKYFGLNSLEELPKMEDFKETADEILEEHQVDREMSWADKEKEDENQKTTPEG